MVRWMPPVTRLWAIEALFVVASLKSFFTEPGVVLALAALAVLGAVFAGVGIFMMESLGRSLRSANRQLAQSDEQTRVAISTGIQTLMAALRPPSEEPQGTPTRLQEAIPERSGGPPNCPPQPEHQTSVSREVAVAALPAGTDATGEVENPATDEPVLLVQNQHSQRGASLLGAARREDRV